MSLLRDVLKKKKGPIPPEGGGESSSKDKKNYAASVKSSSGMSLRSIRSVADSITSFYSMITGRVPKRRRAEVSRLGAPKWYKNKPPLPTLMPGLEKVPPEVRNVYTAAHGVVNPFTGPEGQPPVSVVLYSAALPGSQFVRYYSEARVKGEIRLTLAEPKAVKNVDVFVLGIGQNSFDNYSLVQSHARLWGKSSTDAEAIGIKLVDGKLPTGGYIFPFEFKELNEYTKVHLRLTEREKEGGSAWVPLPPSYRFTNNEKLLFLSARVYYCVKVVVEYKKILDLPAMFEIPFTYYPAYHPSPRSTTQFPFFPHREDWPTKREVVGGWTITPFGGRGRLKDEVVEMEGLLGVQSPEVCIPGQRLNYSLILWSANRKALEVFSNPDNIDVTFMSSDMVGPDVLRPSNRARRNRFRYRISQGRIWRTDDGLPKDDTMPVLKPDPALKAAKSGEARSSVDIPVAGPSMPRKSDVHKPTRHSHLQESFTVEEDGRVWKKSSERSSTLVEEGEEHSRSPSPSVGDAPDGPDYKDDQVIRLDGDIVVTPTMPPSFRYEYMGREYLINIFFDLPEYSHVSPSGPGIEAETPLWVVLDPTPPEGTKPAPILEDFSTLPLIGELSDVGESPKRLPLVIGGASDMEVPKKPITEGGPTGARNAGGQVEARV